MRGVVHSAIEVAKRIPDVPPVPTNYSGLLAAIQEWIEQLGATNNDLAAAQQETKQQREENETQKAAATEDIFDAGWHQLAWLR
jgi:hypothetical protein